MEEENENGEIVIVKKIIKRPVKKPKKKKKKTVRKVILTEDGQEIS